MKDFYLLTTEHLESCLWFRDEDDFKVAMNYVAIQAACCPDVDVLAFILMSNHVHFVLLGTNEDVRRFAEMFKGRYSRYYGNKYGVKAFLRRNDVDVKLVEYEYDSWERVIAYVQMNCVAANICAHPSQYQWGTGNLFFTQTKPSGKRLEEMSARARQRILHSNNVDLPLNWRVLEDGYIDSRSYVNVEMVESMFRTPRRMNYYLITSSKAKKKIEAAEDNLPSFRDQTILNILPELCRSLFQKESFEYLTETEQSEFARQIRFRFSSDANQIARVCGITYAKAARLLDSL